MKPLDKILGLLTLIRFEIEQERATRLSFPFLLEELMDVMKTRWETSPSEWLVCGAIYGVFHRTNCEALTVEQIDAVVGLVKDELEGKMTPPTLADLCKLEGYTLVIDADPCGRSDSIGNSKDHGRFAQLCENKVIAVPHDGLAVYYAVIHEIAHDRKGYPPVKASVVLEEQIQTLLRWMGHLINYMKDPEWAAGPSRSIKDIVAGLPDLQAQVKADKVLRALEKGTVVLGSWVTQQVGADATNGIKNAVEEGLVIPVFAMQPEEGEPLRWAAEPADVGAVAGLNLSSVLVGFKRL